MGIVVENDSFETCNLLNALEIARNDLYMKQLEKNDTHYIVSVENATDLAEAPALTWLHDESSEAEDFILVESRSPPGWPNGQLGPFGQRPDRGHQTQQRLVGPVAQCL
jgi:hypothetical protein